MKKFSFTLALLLAGMAAFGQLKLGIRAGISTSDIKGDDINVIENGIDRFKIAVKDAKYGVHAGVVIQARLGRFLVQPEILFNSNRVDFSVDDIGAPGTVVREEKYQYLDIPVLLGYDFGLIRLHGGPIGHVFLDSASGLTDLEGYKQDFQELTLGWQAGLGIDLWKLMIDLRYEGNFSKFGDHIVFGNTHYDFDQNPSRILVSLGFMFGKTESARRNR